MNAWLNLLILGGLLIAAMGIAVLVIGETVKYWLYARGIKCRDYDRLQRWMKWMTGLRWGAYLLFWGAILAWYVGRVEWAVVAVACFAIVRFGAAYAHGVFTVWARTAR